MYKRQEPQRPRIERGVRQVAALWRKDDGDLAAFVREHFIADDKTLTATLNRLQTTLEQVDGHLNEISRELRRPTDTDTGPLSAMDSLLGSIDPSVHMEMCIRDRMTSSAIAALLSDLPLASMAGS